MQIGEGSFGGVEVINEIDSGIKCLQTIGLGEDVVFGELRVIAESSVLRKRNQGPEVGNQKREKEPPEFSACRSGRDNPRPRIGQGKWSEGLPGKRYSFHLDSNHICNTKFKIKRMREAPSEWL